MAIFFGIICGLNVVYMLHFWGRWIIHRPQNIGVGSRPDISVSVVVAARNEAQNLVQNLPLWLGQQCDFLFEVIVINDQSTDDTAEILAQHAARHAHLRTITHLAATPNQTQNTHINGKMAALHTGITAARHTHILLTDADCAPASPHWLRHIAHTYTPATDIVLGYGSLSTHNNLLGLLVQYDTIITATNYFGYHLAGITYMGVGRNLSYTKKIYIDNNGFEKLPKNAFGDDDLFVANNANSINTKLCAHPEAHTVSSGKSTWASWFNQKKRHLATAKHYKSNHLLFLSLGFGLFLMQIIGYFGLMYIYCQNKNLELMTQTTLYFIITMLLRWIILGISANKLDEKRLILFLPIIDIIYPILQGIWAVQGYFFKIKKWR